MSSATAILQYKRQSVLTAPPVKIVAMLYERAIRGLRQAEAGLAEKRYDHVSREIGLAQEIVGELLTALDFEVGGEIARNLQRLYTFSLETLTAATIDKDPGMIAQVRTVLGTLHEAWDDISRR